MEFNFTKLFFTIELQRDISDPYLFFGIRREFTELFRKTVGCRGFGDEKCPSAAVCPYEQLFSQEMNADPYVVKRFQKPPLPFVFDPPLLPPAPNRGRRVEIGLKLAGRAVNHLLCFIEAIRSMFDRGSGAMPGVGKVIRIESADYFDNRMVVFENGGEIESDRFYVLSMDGLEKTATLPPDAVSLTIATPLRILKDGLPVRELSFSALAMNLLRRMSAMAFYYCSMELGLDYRYLSRTSCEIDMAEGDLRWVDWGRNRCGIIGRGTFIGNLAEFHPFLLFGENFHAGKGAAYGLGSYVMERAA